MTAADQDPAAAAEPMHERRLSHSSSFGTASESPLPSPAPSLSAPSSCERVPVSELERQSSLSSTSSYESFYQIDAVADPAADHEFVPTTLPPAVQTMMAQGQPAAPAYDPKRLPSSMFRTQSTCPAEWSATSDQSLFSIQLENSGDLGGSLYSVGDLYYDDAGVFHRLSSTTRLPAVPEVSPSPGSSSGGSCVRDDCGKCVGGSSMAVRIAATANGDVSPALSATLEEGEASATEPGAAADGWCCWPSLWWPSCACRCGACRWS
uniref:Uncharacterized protein n=1 Tax=Avena sativa TaxID=4498 RepID=A0ACD5U727_AVESA